MTVFLTGYMGSGKSTLGRELAGLLNYSFIDLDDEIIRETGKTIPELFRISEDYFREVESKVLRTVCASAKTVIATGGGTSCFHDNMELMNDSGITVYLKTSETVLTKRILSSSQERPLTDGKTEEELSSTITQMLEKREPYYNQAKIIVDADSVTASELAFAIDRYLLSGQR